MKTNNSSRCSPWFKVWFIVAAIGGVCCLVLPPFLTEGALVKPAYGWPLIPWFAAAQANIQMGVSALCSLLLGLMLGVAQPRRWFVLACAAVAVSPIFMAINIIHDWTKDSTSHNLFPLEFVMYAIVGLPVVPGAFGGFLLRRLSGLPASGVKAAATGER